MTESSARSSRPRDWRFDALRACAAFAVVVLHTTGQFQHQPERSAFGALAVVAHCLARAAVPLFFLTSGYFALTRLQSSVDVVEFWRKRLKRLWLPTLFWSAIYLALYLVSQFSRGQAVDATRVLYDWLWNGKPGAGYHLWFLYALFMLELVAPWVVLERRKRARQIDAALVALWGVFAVTTLVAIAFGGGDLRGSLYIGVIALGYLPWYCWGAFTGVKAGAFPAFMQREAGTGALFVAGVGLGAMVATTYLLNYWLARSDFLPPCLLLSLGLWGYALTRREEVAPRLRRVAKTLGELSFGIYVLHIAVLELVSRAVPTASETVPGALASSVVAFLLAALLTAAFKRIPFLRRML